jgi:hypothetical protein
MCPAFASKDVDEVVREVAAAVAVGRAVV